MEYGANGKSWRYGRYGRIKSGASSVKQQEVAK
jgi:hypothetical protein